MDKVTGIMKRGNAGLLKEGAPALQESIGEDGVAGAPQDEGGNFGDVGALGPACGQPRIIGVEFGNEAPRCLAFAGVGEWGQVLLMDVRSERISIGKDDGEQPAWRQVQTRVEVFAEATMQEVDRCRHGKFIGKGPAEGVAEDEALIESRALDGIGEGNGAAKIVHDQGNVVEV